MLVLLGVYLMAQSIARTNISMCQAANICASQPTYYHAARNGKSRGKPGRRSADHPATLWLSQTAELPCLAGELADPRVVALYGATSPQELRVPSAFFTGGGWQPDKPYYTGSFDPAKQWKSKAKGELMVTFDGDERSTKVTLRALLDHSFSVVALTQNFMNSPECAEEEPDAAATPFARDANGHTPRWVAVEYNLQKQNKDPL